MLLTAKIATISGVIFLLIGGTTVLIALFLIKRKETIYKYSSKVANSGCQLYPFEVELHPLVIISGTNDFIYPEPGEKELKFAPKQSLDFACPGRTVIVGQYDTKNSIITGSCVSASKFMIVNKKVDWNTLACNDIPWRTMRYTGNTCENKGREIEIGFDLGSNRFLRSLLICFNRELQIAHYSYINQTASINQRIVSTPRPSFRQGTGFYDIHTVNNLYLRNNQKVTVNKLLGLPDNSDKYIKNTGNYYLARGHLTARSDAFYAAQQNATFFYPNVAPQWQTFNGLNWKQIETDVKNYAENNAVDLQVWTGIHGVSTLPHEATGNPVKLYLFFNETSNRKALPVPEFFWKVAYNAVTKRGIALIGINNPYNSTLATICNDVSPKLSWLHCKKENPEQGFCYACRIATFRKVVTSMPYIPDNGILL